MIAGLHDGVLHSWKGSIMTADPRIIISFRLSHPPSAQSVVRELIEKIRLRATELGSLQVGELVALTTDEAIAVSKFGQHRSGLMPSSTSL